MPYSCSSLDGALDVRHGLRLLELVQRLLVDRLEAEVDELAAGAAHEVEQLRVADDVGADLGRPRDDEILVDHHLQQLLEPLAVGGHVVVVEEDALRPLVLDLGDDALGAAEPVLLAEHRRHRAEGAVERAAPAGHDRHRRELVAAHEQAQVRERQLVEVGEGRSRGGLCTATAVAREREAGDALELAVAGQRLDELEHELLAALAAGDVVDVLEGLVGHERDVGAADDDGDALGPELVGEAVGRGRRRGRAGEADEVRAADVVPVDGREGRVVDEHVVAVLLERRGDDRQSQAGEQDLRVHVHPGGLGLDEADLHDAPW